MQEEQYKFIVNRRSESPFRPGFRSYFVDRDLGLREATGGDFMAEVHRAAGPCPEGGTGTHVHKLKLQFNYVLKGWCRMEFEGRGEFRLEEGDTWLQPSEIRHNFIECSSDCEILEICSPGKFETVDV